MRTSTTVPAAGETAATMTFTFTVWYSGEPPHDGTLLALDGENAPVQFSVNSGAFFTVRTDEKDYFPQGFLYDDLTPE